MALRAQVLDAVRRVPGVTAASVASRLPLAPDLNMDSIAVPGHHSPGDDGTSIDTVYVGADYFAVTGRAARGRPRLHRARRGQRPAGGDRERDVRAHLLAG